MQTNVVDLVIALHEKTYGTSLSAYQKTYGEQALKNMKLSEKKDIYEGLSKEQQDFVFSAVEEAVWNATSLFFACLSGSSPLDIDYQGLELKLKGDTREIYWDLHDIWVEMMQGGDIAEMKEYHKDLYKASSRKLTV